MLPEALPTPPDPLPNQLDSLPASLFGDVAGQSGRRVDEPVGFAVDAFAVEWQIVTSGDPAQ
jgi:hypothetical protein